MQSSNKKHKQTYLLFLQKTNRRRKAGWTQPLAFENHGNVENHAFPRFGNFVKVNGQDPGAIMTQNVFPVISVQPLLYQLPFGDIFLWGTGCFKIVPKNLLNYNDFTAFFSPEHQDPLTLWDRSLASTTELPRALKPQLPATEKTAQTAV